MKTNALGTILGAAAILALPAFTANLAPVNAILGFDIVDDGAAYAGQRNKSSVRQNARGGDSIGGNGGRGGRGGDAVSLGGNASASGGLAATATGGVGGAATAGVGGAGGVGGVGGTGGAGGTNTNGGTFQGNFSDD